MNTEIKSGNLNYTKALDAMVLAGQTVRRFNGNMPGKFYRNDPKAGVRIEIQSAKSERALINDEWERASTDVNSWFNSTYRIVHVKIAVCYEGVE